VGIDHHDDANVPSPEHPDRPPDQPRFETRDRQEYYADRRATKPAFPSQPAKQTENPQPPQSRTTWEETAELSRWMWTEYKRRWPPEDRPPPDRSTDEPGSWRGDNVRFLPSAVNAELEGECDRISHRERETISPRLGEVESCDPDRCLIGYEYRLKDRDRVKEKVYDDMDLLGRSSIEAISLLPDAIRYTFQYDEVRYTHAVRADIARMKEQGFRLDILKNSWSGDQYKGINSQWIDPETGQRFELQFHTRISFEAKQLTHSSYERLRSKQTDAFEELVLEAFQKKVSAAVPIPLGATDIPDYREGEQHAR
jgi:hypothetical protein